MPKSHTGDTTVTFFGQNVTQKKSYNCKYEIFPKSVTFYEIFKNSFFQRDDIFANL